MYNRRITAQSAAQWLALNPDMSVALLNAAANPGISSFQTPQRLRLGDKFNLRPAVRVCQALVDAEQARISGGFLKSSASALVSLQSQPQLSPAPAVRRRLFSRSAPPAVAVFPSEQAQGAMEAVEKMEETMGSLALLLGGPAEMEERLALGGGPRQLPSAASSVSPAPSSLG